MRSGQGQEELLVCGVAVLHGFDPVSVVLFRKPAGGGRNPTRKLSGRAWRGVLVLLLVLGPMVGAVFGSRTSIALRAEYECEYGGGKRE